jgi:hypothetical protein
MDNIVWVPAPKVNVTELDPGAKAPPVFDQFPDTVNVPEGAVRVPLVRVTSEEDTVPVEPVNVPPVMDKPPSSD